MDTTDVIVFCSGHFMAKTANIPSFSKIVMLHDGGYDRGGQPSVSSEGASDAIKRMLQIV